MADKYISAKAFLFKTQVEMVEEKAMRPTDANFHTFLDAVYALIERCVDEMPAADVAERKKGKWIRKGGTPVNCMLDMMEEAFCDQCGESAPGYPFWECRLELTDFCPHCGVDMINGKGELKRIKKKQS